MCRFFSGQMYEFDIIQKYDYYLRLDTDSYITTRIPYDIFELAERLTNKNINFHFVGNT